MEKSFSPKIKVQRPSFVSEFSKVSDDLVMVRRYHNWQSQSLQLDTVAKHWWLFFLEKPTKNLKLFSGGEWLCGADTDSLALLWTPFSVLKWQIMPGYLEWSAYISSAQLPTRLLEGPFIVSWDSSFVPKNSKELLQKLSPHKPLQAIETFSDPQGIALKAKSFVDAHFGEELSVKEIAHILGFDHSVLARAFKKSFEMSLSTYRNKLRVMNAKAHLLFEPASVLDTALEAGFHSPSGLNKAFHKVLDISPSQLTKSSP